MSDIFKARSEDGVGNTWYEVRANTPRDAAINFMEEYVTESGDISPRMIEIKGYGSFGVELKLHIYQEPVAEDSK